MSADDDINALIVQAVTNLSSTESGPTLAELYARTTEGGTELASSLDPLSILSVLLPLRNSDAQNWIEFLGRCCSAKEVVLAIQEELERITERAENDEEGENSGDSSGKSTLVERLIALLLLSKSAITRLEPRRRTPSETLKFTLSELRQALEAISSRAKPSEGRKLLVLVEGLAEDILGWVQGLPAITRDEVAKCQRELKSLDDHALLNFRSSLRCDTAQRALEVCFPRLRRVGEDQNFSDNPDAQIVIKRITRYDAALLETLGSTPSVISVILLVHSWLSSMSTPALSNLTPFLPSLFTMLQPASTLHDDALAFLLLFLHRNQTTIKTEVSPDIIYALTPPIVALSSAHPSPSIRHQAFRVLSFLLSSGPTQLRLQLLADLVADSEYPQMRVAAVGLVKDAVLEALNSQSESRANVFGTPMFMRVFGPLLFRPSPPDLFVPGTKLDLGEFLDSPEPKRLTEVLSLYYVVLLRDKGNKTGIRDKDMLSTLDKNLLNPLREWLKVAMEGDRHPSSADDHALMPLVSLKTGLDRVMEARANL
ncbi:hypothetical protein AN958_05407 [Leucoagaricus sp. SymC.cos]|nr:hypothetical protein AN958_05407 [Leucoagaricus sp. SymC.cos]